MKLTNNKIMTGQEAVELLYQAHVSIHRFAKDTGLAYSTVHGWKKGKPMNPANQSLVKLYIHAKNSETNPQPNEQPKQS